MTFRTIITLLCLGASVSAVCAQDDVMDKIKALELQIQELKLLKEQQNVTTGKFDDCMKVVARDGFCGCVSESLPVSVGFEQYVHMLLTPREKLGYGLMSAEQKKGVDAVIEVREKCIEKGFFK